MRLRAVALLVVLGVFGSPAHAEFEQQLGPLAGAVRPQLMQGWTASVQDGWFTLYNAKQRESEQTLLVRVGPPPESGRVTNLNVVVRSEHPKAAIGVMLNNQQRKSLCLMEITADRSTHLFCLENGKRREVATVPNSAKLDGSDRIRVIEVPGAARFLLNGQKVGDIEDTPALDGDIGIMAYDVGTFGLAEFTIDNDLDRGRPAAAPAPGAQPPRTGSPAPDSPPPRRESGGGGGGGAGNSVAGTGPLPLFGGDSKRTTSVYIGLVRSIFLHEFGHALIGELELPSTGAEEDAVDIYSALRIVEPTMYPSQNADENDMVRDAAVYAALQWFYSGKLAEARGAGESPWQDEHTGDLKRFRNMFCIMYGGNTAAFASLANAVELDERTRSRCTDEFNKQNRAWRKILAPHTRVGTWSPDGQQPANAPGAPVNVVFEPSKSKVGNLFANNFAEPLAQNFSQLGKTYVLPRPVNVTFKDCGTLNAWYDPRAGSVTMCYELLEHLAVMISDIEMGTVGGMPKGDAAAQPARQQGAPGQGAGQGAAPPRAIDELQDMGIPATALLFSSPYKGPTPNKHFNAQIIRTEDFLVLAKNHRDMVLIDTSGQMETIPSAISLADAGSDGSVTDSLQSALDAWLTKTAGEGRKAPLVFFGAGLNDRSSYNAALRAATLGWPTYWYRGGMQAWKANGGTTVPLKSRKDAPQQ